VGFRLVRADYGSDELLTTLVLQSIRTWKKWNEKWNEEVYHNTGLLLLKATPIAAGTYEDESFKMQKKLGAPVERLSQTQIKKRFPRWNAR